MKQQNFFASRWLEAAVAYGCKHNLCGHKDLGSVPSNGKLFLVVSFFNCKTIQYMRTQVQFPEVVNLFGF